MHNTVVYAQEASSEIEINNIDKINEISHDIEGLKDEIINLNEVGMQLKNIISAEDS
ncbi:hypothetical protein [Microaceticoccus formicicus]|uniref:hypothetical protein n=1 Tax=Microaceticoccus formicicus TaxID=3118105 RepID=UPI003CCFFDCF|nr:hypothetical protein VZL98_09445 [Peptoniphilaceae bacterium AMB_02]